MTSHSERSVARSARSTRRQQIENLFRPLPDMLDLGCGLRGERNCSLRLVGLCLCAQLLACAGNRESLLVQQLLDPQHALDIALAVHALSSAAFDWPQLRKLGLPEAQHVRRQAAKRSYLADPEIQLVRNKNFIRCMLSGAFLPRCHAESRGKCRVFRLL